MYLTLAFVKEFGFKAGEAWSKITEYAYGCLSYSDFATTEMLIPEGSEHLFKDIYTAKADELYHHVLDKFGLGFMQTISFILIIAALVQMVEIILKKVSPALYQALGVFLPLITTNCCILGVAILVIQKEYNLLESVVYAISTAIGFALALVIFAGIREQLALTRVPEGMKGTPIALITAGLLAMAFMGFSGVDKGLAVLFGLN